MGGGRFGGPLGSYVLTRLHARYAKDALGSDLVFKEAPAIVKRAEAARKKALGQTFLSKDSQEFTELRSSRGRIGPYGRRR